MCNEIGMPTNLNIDDRLLNEALKLGGRRSKRETVNEALAEYVQKRRRRELVEHFGKIDFDPGWDYKKARRAR
jgi:Arc/MetJ family transcription regulator